MELNQKNSGEVVKELEVIYEKVANPTCVHMLAEMESVGVGPYMSSLFASLRSDEALDSKAKTTVMESAENLAVMAVSCLLFNLAIRDREFLEYAITEEALARHQSEVRAELSREGSSDE